MRWLLLKDLQILRRSPLLVALLVVYPILVAVLLGLALSGGPGKPRVAFANLVPPEKGEFAIGGEVLELSRYSEELFKSIEPLPVASRAEAVEKVREGEALGALVIPEDATDRLQATINLAGGQPPTVEVLYNAEDPVKRRYVEGLIEARLADANQALSRRLTEIAVDYLGIIVSGGEFALLGQTFEVLGLRRSDEVLRRAIETLPAGAPERAELERVARFARLASENLDISEPILASIGTPVRAKQTIVEGRRTALDAFAVAVAVTLSLMMLTMLLAAGLLSMEREENTFGRLARGLVSRSGLLAEKVVLACGCGLVVGTALVCALGVVVGIAWERAPLWLAAIALTALAFAAMGVAVGALAREVRVASLLAFLVSLPIAFLALVPSGSISAGAYEAIQAISAAFPFKPGLRALDSSINDVGGSPAGALAHLTALAAGFGLLARLALRRF